MAYKEFTGELDAPAKAGKFREFTGELDEPIPVSLSLGDVALNAIPKGVANLLHTPTAMENLVRKGLSYIPGVPASYTTPKENVPMQLAEKIGLVDPKKNPTNVEGRILDTAIQSGVSSLVAPAAGIGGVVKNVLTGLASGGAAQTTKEATGSDVASIGVGMLTPFLLRSTAKPQEAVKNAARDKALAEARSKGLVIPASEVNPSFAQNRLESIAGKAAIKQEAVARNQAIADRLAAKDIDLPETTPLTPGRLQQERLAAGAPYAEASKLRPTAKTEWFPRYHQTDLVEQMKQARADASRIRKGLLTSNDPAALEKAKSLESLADSLQDDIGKLAKSNNREALIDDLVKARTKIAKIHDLENATSVVGEVSVPTLGRMLDQKPLSGNMGMLARFQQAFPKFAGEASRSPTPGVSAVEPLSMAGLGMGGAGLGQAGWLAGGLPLVRGPVRSMLLSPAYQRMFATPDFGGVSAREKLIQGILAARGYGGAQ